MAEPRFKPLVLNYTNLLEQVLWNQFPRYAFLPNFYFNHHVLNESMKRPYKPCLISPIIKVRKLVQRSKVNQGHKYEWQNQVSDPSLLIAITPPKFEDNSNQN